ncbi:MAG: efflux RND transporter periplasmic adaptor subunit [Verrucomicrobiota bacterium]
MKKNRLKIYALLLVAFAIAPSSFPHAGHDKAPGEDGEGATKGPITISDEAKKNLGLKVEEASLQTLEKTFTVIGEIEAIPNRTAAVSSRIPGRIIQLKTAEGQAVKKGEAVLEVESRQLGEPPPRVQLFAPIDGVVVHQEAVTGDTVEPDKHLLEIADLSEVYAEGRIFEGQVANVKLGQKVRVSVESFPKETFTGTVDLLSGTLDAESRTLKVWVRIKNPDAKLRPNMRARLNIVTAEADSVIAIPPSAVLGEAGNLFVFVQSDTNELVFEKRTVVTGMKDDRFVEIIEGVFPSDKIVTVGNYQLQYVTSRKAPEKAGGTNAPAAAHEDSHATGVTSRIPKAPFLWMGITIAVLLLLNAIILLVRKRPSSQSTVSNQPRSDAVSK